MTMTKVRIGIIGVMAIAGMAVPLSVTADSESPTNTSGPQPPPFSAVAATSQTFHVEGELEYDTVQTGDLLKPLARRAFTVDVAGYYWKIRSTALVPPADPADAILHIELTNSFDGIYKLTAHDGAKMQQANRPLPRTFR